MKEQEDDVDSNPIYIRCRRPQSFAFLCSLDLTGVRTVIHTVALMHSDRQTLRINGLRERRGQHPCSARVKAGRNEG